MPAAAPTVSIVIPAYRKAATLARALQSVVNQSYRDFELHVVDDSGNEDLRPLVARYAVTSYTPQNCQAREPLATAVWPCAQAAMSSPWTTMMSGTQISWNAPSRRLNITTRTPSG
ncbi:glycosyltransferase family 2 protein [Verrucomicrobium spinosum]|uniref:glycosyltransferase family 2 protein n=1 Tax=Verrucomicrobium spinosum TaxID=2736 RepID=UPI0009466E20|nr:glycosyltransferase [Verrucomicrobium spinosum]